MTRIMGAVSARRLRKGSPIALYRKFGFVEEGRSRGFAMREGILADVLHMARLVDAPRLQSI